MDKVCDLGHFFSEGASARRLQIYTSRNCCIPERMHDNSLVLPLLQMLDVCLQAALYPHLSACHCSSSHNSSCVLNLMLFGYINCHRIEPVYSRHLDLTVMLSCDEVPRKCQNRFVRVRMDGSVVTVEHFSVQKNKMPECISFSQRQFNICLTNNEVDGISCYQLRQF